MRIIVICTYSVTGDIIIIYESFGDSPIKDKKVFLLRMDMPGTIVRKKNHRSDFLYQLQ